MADMAGFIDCLNNSRALAIILPAMMAANPSASLHLPFYNTNTSLPNTLCHIAFQAPLNRGFCRDGDLFWVIMACSIPDLPWILLRLLLPLESLDPLDLRLYTTIQASLIFCLILSAALAQLGRNPGRAFALLALNCLLHLLLDATQIKWANGVHFFLPISWSAVQWHIFWPEHPLGPIITAGGLLYYLRIWPRLLAEKPQWPQFGAARCLILVGCLLFYLTGPFLFCQRLEETGFYGIDTLRDRAARPGKQVEFDRVPYSAGEKTITILTGERIRLLGPVPKTSGLISLQGQFMSAATVQTARYHQHGRMRDWASLLGLFMTCTLLVQTLILSRFPFHQPLKGQQA